MNTQQALLSNEANYTVFRFGDKTIRFRAPYSLERYTGIHELGTTAIWSSLQNIATTRTPRKNISTLSLS